MNRDEMLMDFERLVHGDDAIDEEYLDCTNAVCALHRQQLDDALGILRILRTLLGATGATWGAIGEADG